VLRTPGGRGKGAECLTETFREVRSDTPPGEDTAGGIWAERQKERKAAGKETRHLRFLGADVHLRTQPKGEVHSTREDDGQAAPQGAEGDRRVVSRTPPRPCGPATENPECQTPRPLPILRPANELPQPLAVLSDGPVYLAQVAESPHTRARADVGTV